MPKVCLTSRFVDTVRAGPKQVDYWDTNLTGLSLRVTPKERKVWTVMYRYHFRLRRLTLGTPAPKNAPAQIQHLPQGDYLRITGSNLDP